MKKKFSVLGLLGVLLLAIGAGARAEAPAVLAIQGARIVPVSGPVLEKGTVVVRDGLIEAVGANVTIPADARVLDGSGLTVYPGLIDALTDLGLPQTAAPAAGRTGVSDQLGSIEKGKIANLVITDGDLLELRTNVKQVFIAGKPVSLETRHTRLYEKYLNRP